MDISNLKILLVEDDNGDAELIREMVAGCGGGCGLKITGRLSSGLQLLEEEPFDAVLLDLGLPDSVGVNALLKIQEKHQGLPVIILTGLSDEELAIKAISLGAQDYIEKGNIDWDTLSRSVIYSVERKQTGETIRRSKELSDALNHINSLINSILDPDEIMQRAIMEAALAIRADSASIGLFEDGSVYMKYAYNMPQEFCGQRFSADEAKGIYHVASLKDAVAFNCKANDNSIDVCLWNRFGERSPVVVAPLIIRDEVIGAISFYCLSCGYDFTEMCLDFTRKLATSISSALENARLYDDRRRMEEEITHLANHDELTGLPNRRLFTSLAGLEVAQSRRHGTKMAIFFLDLDRFKDINDSLGHETGDELLKEVARRLKAMVRASDTVARIGGDEFNIIISDVSRLEDIADVARKIVESFQKSFMINGHEFHMTASIGISIYPDDNEEIQNLLRYADIAMYNSKKEGRNTWQFYNPEIKTRSIERIRFDTGLRQSIERGELIVYYQPVVEKETNKIVCAEALVRWQHPELGLLDAARFVPLAEETGFIAFIDEWVLRTACAQVRAWRDSGLSPSCITVNLSARQFQSPELVGKVSRILDQTGLPPACLRLEITESMAMKNIGRTAASMHELAALGVHIYIDDFGIGYSSLNYLKRLPIDCLKIDKSFIRDIATDSDDRSIIGAVTAMAHNMKMKVIAEGVETEEQFSFLRSVGCDELQGFLFSRPLPAAEYEELMRRA